jgi:hypothetical protein
VKNQFWSMVVAGVGLSGCCFGGGGAAVSLAPGFTPDPHTETGHAIGVNDASGFGEGCIGRVPASPSHVLNVTAALPYLRVVANGGSNDITLVIQKPDGSYLCNDDSDGLNPMIEGAFAAGEYKVFIGNYSTDDAGAAYKVGFTTQNSVTPSTIGAP